MIYFGSSNHLKKMGAKKQNGGPNQDGRQTKVLHSSVNLYANKLNLETWKKRFLKK
jgi:hypothetical protein